MYALLYAGKESDDEKENITPEQAFEAAQAANGRVQTDSAEVTEESTKTSDSEEITAKPNAMNPNTVYLVFGAIALIGVGAAGYIFMKKKNSGNITAKETVDDEDEDDITFPDDENY